MSSHRRALLPIAAALSAAVSLATSQPAAAKPPMMMEKCYGITKAGKNDCATAKTSCSGTSTKDGQKDAWLYLPKGTCQKLVGASTKKPS